MARGNAKGDNRNEHRDEVDALFAVPLSEFTAARNDLIRRFKQEKRADEAERVKALNKPPISAWVVNQLYWNHRNEFDRLLAAGASLGQAHASQLAGKRADVRAPLTAKREAVSLLLQLADKILRDAGHNSTPDTMRRITTSLEALATHPLSGANAPIPGRLTADIAPLGFESLAALIPESRPFVPATEPEKVTAASKRKVAPDERLTSARAALKASEEVLREARSRTEGITAALQEAEGVAKEREKARQRAEADLANANTSAEEARRRVKELKLKAEQLKAALDESERAVQEARTQLQQSEDL